MKSRLIVSALIEKGNRVLLCRKAPGQGPYPDTWHLPGGGVDLETETAEEAVIREIREETGLEVQNLEKAAWDTDVEPDKRGIPTYYVFLQFRCKYESGEPNAKDDLECCEWVPLEKIGAYDLNRPTQILLEKLNTLRKPRF